MNVFKQRGALSFVIRLVNSQDPITGAVRTSKEIVDLTEEKERTGAGNRTNPEVVNLQRWPL